jgi:protein-tyrosine-phosphatase
MNRPSLLLSLMIGATLIAIPPATHAAPADVLESLKPAVAQAMAAFGKIPADRQRELKKIALFVQSKIAAGESAQVTFICTHNSRRSHLSQIWAQTASTYYSVAGFKGFSGGTEATACNERAIAALTRAGFSITSTPAQNNPVYLVKYSDKAEPIRAYSKVYQTPENPQSNFLAAMTCDHADGNCPVVQGAAMRVPVHYVDPKVADGKPEEAATYDERSQQIASEMFYLMSLVKH